MPVLLMLTSGCCCCLVTKLYLTLCYPMNCSPPGSSVHGIFQARMLEWAVPSSSWGSSRLRDWTHLSYISCIGRQAGNISVFPPSSGSLKVWNPGVSRATFPLKDIGKNPSFPLLVSGGPRIPCLVGAEPHLYLLLHMTVFCSSLWVIFYSSHKDTNHWI